jgi:hypothetical protein
VVAGNVHEDLNWLLIPYTSNQNATDWSTYCGKLLYSWMEIIT